ncbi:hypothetical protein I6E46_07615 [Prevotella loescheii]|nr:hypothetical protein [Hoylesella loescheii]
MNGEELAVSGGDRKGRDNRRQRLVRQSTETKTTGHDDKKTTAQATSTQGGGMTICRNSDMPE